MISRLEVRRRRQWRSSAGRILSLTAGWSLVLFAHVALGAFAITGRLDLLGAGVAAAAVAWLLAGLVPDPAPPRRRARFAPLEGLRRQRRRQPSLARQLLTLP
jgi:hypothetical protein